MASNVISIVGKGSSGKTRTAIELAKAFVKLGLEVTIIDLDPQHSATFATFGEFTPICAVADVLSGKCTWAAARIKSDDGYYIIPGAPGLGDTYRLLDRRDSGFLAVKAITDAMSGIVILDPSAEVESFSYAAAVAASNQVIATVNPCPWAVQVAKGIEGSVAGYYDESLGVTPKFAGYLATMIAGAKIVGGGTGLQIAQNGISSGLREALEAIRQLPGYTLGYIPTRRGKDQRDLIEAYAQVALTLQGF